VHKLLNINPVPPSRPAGTMEYKYLMSVYIYSDDAIASPTAAPGYIPAKGNLTKCTSFIQNERPKLKGQSRQICLKLASIDRGY
jgi:hypothetical protein